MSQHPNSAVDPTLDEIAERCRAIQSEWSDEEHVKRTRVDWRPQAAQTRRVTAAGCVEPVERRTPDVRFCGLFLRTQDRFHRTAGWE